ncbi:MAG: ankyrin repeat domain-containing protein [Pseudomonadota bacterium]
MTDYYRKRSLATVSATLLLIAAAALPVPALADKLVAAKYRPVDKRLTFPANEALPTASALTERQLLDDGYEPIGVVSVVLRVSHCKTVQECEWLEEPVDANRKALELAGGHGAEIVTLWSDNREFVRTRSPGGLARVGVPKDCERTPSGTVLTPGKTQYEVRCSFDSDFIRRTLYLESRGIAWRSGGSARAGENAREAVELLDDLYRKDHKRSYARAVAFGNEMNARTNAPKAATASPPSRDDIEDATTLPRLLQAARNGDVDTVRAELDEGVKVSTATAQNNTTVHFAAAAGQVQVLKLLFERGAAWQQRNRNGATALYLAARYGHTAAVTTLLEAGANIDEQSLNFIDLTPAMVAAKYGHGELLTVLLDRGAEIDRKDKEGQDVLTHAVAAGHDELVVPLLERMGPELRGQALKSALYVAIMHKQAAAVDLLLQQGALTDYRYTTAISREYTPLSLAAIERNPDIARRLLAAGADPNVSTGAGNPLTLAVGSHRHAKIEILESGAAIAVMLLQAGAEPNQRRAIGEVRMAKADEHSGHETLIDYLLTEGVLDEGGLQQMYSKAVRAGRLDYLRRIAQLAGREIAPEDTTALLKAAVHSGSVPTVDHVLALGADIDELLNRQGETALLLAAKHRDVPMATFLLQRGADPDRADGRGQKAISLAYAQDDLRMVRTLSGFDGGSAPGAGQ